MKLITEHTDDIQIITEERDGKKAYFIEGVFMQSDIKNRNGRVYPNGVLVKEAMRYNKEFVESNRAMGELGHPEGPQLNLDRVSHIIKEMKVDGKNIWGKAKVMDTPYGKIVKNMIDEGVKFGVSSRGVGSLKTTKDGINEVQNDFNLAAVDIVADPSAPDAFVEGVMEGKEWVYENGNWRQVEAIKQTIKRTSKRNLEEAKLQAFNAFLRGL
jgi:hypothetical protein